MVSEVLRMAGSLGDTILPKHCGLESFSPWNATKLYEQCYSILQILTSHFYFGFKPMESDLKCT